MPYTLNVIIEGNFIEDSAAKIISCSLKGMSYEQISHVTFIKRSIIYRTVSDLYGRFRLPKCINALNLLALTNGFDYDFKYNGRELLTAEELQRVKEKVPRLPHMDKEVIITIRPGK